MADAMSTLAGDIANLDGSYLDEARATAEELVSGMIQLRKLVRDYPETHAARDGFVDAVVAYRESVEFRYSRGIMLRVEAQAVMRTDPTTGEVRGPNYCTACGGAGWLPSKPEGRSECHYCGGTGKQL